MLGNEITNYLQQFVPARTELIMEMEEVAKIESVPIMELLGIETLLQLLKIKQPKKILEIGTAIGYSAIRMAQALPNATIITVERDESRYNQALRFIKKGGYEKQIEVVLGDALHLSTELEQKGPYDVLFIDAAKGQYERFFELYTPFLMKDGIILSDNVLFKGHVVNDEIDNKRLKGVARKINSYNQWLVNHPKYDTVILPIGDGIALTLTKQEEGEE